MEKTKIIIGDDHDLIRLGLNRILKLEEDFDVLGEGKNGQEVIDLIEKEIPNIVLLDINMPIINGIEALRKIKMNWPSIKVIMLTVENDKKTINDAIDIGADGYVLKESAGSEIVNAIKVVCSGDKYIDKSLVNMFFSTVKRYDAIEKSLLEELTLRELEILLYISKGFRNKEIGEVLFLSEKTIKNYITNIFRKLNVEDRVQATIIALNNDIESHLTKIRSKKRTKVLSK